MRKKKRYIIVCKDAKEDHSSSISTENCFKRPQPLIIAQKSEKKKIEKKKPDGFSKNPSPLHFPGGAIFIFLETVRLDDVKKKTLV